MQAISITLLASALAACGLLRTKHEPLPTVAHVDLNRYMGNWFVIANIPPWIERGAHNSVENYSLDADGNVPTVFTYRKDGFDGESKTLKSRAYVVNRETNAEWGVRFSWLPLKAEYLIAWLADDYSRVIVARSKRDYVWLMARGPTIPEAEYAALVEKIAAMGYDVAKLQRVPQRWP